VSKPLMAKTTAAYDEIRSALTPLLRGRVIVIDPSIGSNSSQPGWSLYINGEYVESGVLQIPVSRDVPARLQELHRQLRELYRLHDPDCLVYEDIAPQRYGGWKQQSDGSTKYDAAGNANAHASLLKAVGATLSVPGPSHFVGLKPTTWKRLVRPGYVKSDEADATEIGYVAMLIARDIEQRDPPRKYGAGRGKRKKREKTETVQT
jgi:hypothetical protein